MEQTGECDERQLNHSAGEAERFYRDLQQRGIRVRVGKVGRPLSGVNGEVRSKKV